VTQSFARGIVVRSFVGRVDELAACSGKRRSDCEKALLELLRTGRDAVPAVSRRPRRTVTKLSRRMRAPKLRRLARAFAAQ
jgi:hypothetical protein